MNQSRFRISRGSVGNPEVNPAGAGFGSLLTDKSYIGCGVPVSSAAILDGTQVSGAGNQVPTLSLFSYMWRLINFPRCLCRKAQGKNQRCCSSVGGAVAFSTRDPQLESLHGQNFINHLYIFSKRWNLRINGWEWPILKKNCHWSVKLFCELLVSYKIIKIHNHLSLFTVHHQKCTENNNG